MDYEKKYKEALERAKQLLRTSVAFDRFTIERIFPELKENEDERVRKAIISGMKALQEKGKYTEFAHIPMDEVFTWLEKQGEQKPVEPQQDMLSQEKYAKAVDECIYGEQKPVNVDYVSGIREELLSIEDSAENIVGLAESQWVAIRAAYRLLGEYIAKEQKLADKVEPKFKVGDWISNDMCDAHIASIEDGMYYFDEGDGLSTVFVDEHYHLWTIEDAMDGDVLVSRSPFIYGKQCPYGGLNWCNNKFIKASNFVFTDSPVHPATKEQRDFLFQKMKEAGYVWDSEKKELRKVEQNPTAWSDEDERNIQNIDSVLFYDKKLPEETCVKLRDFLKTLKQRCI